MHCEEVYFFLWLWSDCFTSVGSVSSASTLFRQRWATRLCLHLWPITSKRIQSLIWEPVCMSFYLTIWVCVCVSMCVWGGPLNKIRGHTSSVKLNQSVPGWVSGPVCRGGGFNNNTNMRADWSVLQSLCTSAGLVWLRLGCPEKEDFVLQPLGGSLLPFAPICWFSPKFGRSVWSSICVQTGEWSESFPNIRCYGPVHVSLGSGWVAIFFPSSSVAL